MQIIKNLFIIFLFCQGALAASEITIICTGDILPGSAVMPSPPFEKTSRFKLRENTFRHVSHILRRGDITIGNLEGPIGHDRLQVVDKGYRGFSFRFPPRSAGILRKAGFNALTLANNHTFDCTGQGLYETSSHLHHAGILSVGLYKLPWHIPELPHSIERTIPVKEVKGIRAAVLGFASREVFKSINYLDECIHIIKDSQKKADITIVTFHGGAELSHHAPDRTEFYLKERRGNTVAFARAAVDAGADLVFGHGPHVLRKMEFYRGKLIAYSLGNFCDMGIMKHIYPHEKKIQTSIILEVVLNQKGTYLRGKIYPITTGAKGIPYIDSSQKGIRIINTLSR